ncbi:MAG: indolepyruvate ferredoxin oxidoreductase subunit alpha [Hyphomicrobiales bacterium]|nr:indolepyruvate ferredoxin oxidoreductase subunit alpha [Hyphomicrobiales bacterium]
MERTFDEEIGQLSLGRGEVVRCEGILAVTKALLQSGVSYVGGYQGAPVSHLLDVLVSAKPYMNGLGVHVEACSNEASAAAMLAASINYPVRGAVTWKSIVGTNVASDALSNLASVGVKGGALIILGEDYGEGASVIQERSLAVALKSSIWLVDPRPNLSSMVDLVEKSFGLSEASKVPVMVQLRIRACHVQGEFVAKDNVEPAHGEITKFAEPAEFLYERVSHPPATFLQERQKIEERLPAAQTFIRENVLNEVFKGRHREIGLILQGGLYNTVVRQLAEMGLADAFGKAAIDLYVLNVTHPLVPDEIERFCRGKKAVLVFEEGSPAFIELEIVRMLSHADSGTRVHGKDLLPAAGEYGGAAVAKGIFGFLDRYRSKELDLGPAKKHVATVARAAGEGAAAFETALPARPPGFCTGCPERPVFGAIKLVERELGKVHVAGDIGCHSFATFPPFSLGNSILGYGLSLASMAAVAPMQERRPIAIMGDGGFWHNGLQTGVLSNLFNKGDGVLVIMQNGYSAATGQQDLPSSPYQTIGGAPSRGADIEKVLKSFGVRWLRTVRTYSVAKMKRALKDALTTAEKGLKVIIADGECMLVRRRREGAEKARDLKAGRRVGEARFGVDEDVCTGDHSCIALSGCPSLTVKPNPDPLRSEPVAHVDQDCAACGLCGEMAHAARLCPSFYRAERIHNAGRFERLVHRARHRAIAALSRVAA